MLKRIFIRICVSVLIAACLIVAAKSEDSSAEQLRKYYLPIVANSGETHPSASNHGKRLLVGVTIRDWNNLIACDSVAFDLYHDWRIPNMGTPDLPECGERIPYLWCSQYPPSLYDQVNGAGAATAYTGIIYFGNEPSLADQCNKSPEEIAVNYLEMRRAFPNAQVVGPHVFGMGGVEYFKEWWAALVQLSGTTDHDLDGVGLHLYRTIGVNKMIIEEYTEFLDSIGQENTQIHITEFSVMSNDSNRESPTILTDFLDYLENNPRIHSVYYWSNVQPCSRAEHAYNFPSTYLVDCDGRETIYLQAIKQWLNSDS